MDEDYNLGSSSADWGGGELAATAPEQHPAAGRVARPNQKRSKNFSAAEDEALVQAWLGVGVDAAQGGERAAYWRRIHDRYHARGGVQSGRNQNSITHRWSTIQDSVGRFERCLARVDGAGTGQDGVITQDEASPNVLSLVVILTWSLED